MNLRNTWLVLSLALPLPAVAAVPVDSLDQSAVNQAVQAMCRRPVVVIGESSHGDGHSDSLKTEIVERLIKECKFNAVLFESSVYEFIPISRERVHGDPIRANQIATAVGGIWKFDQEVYPLFQFLADEENSNKVTVNGLDFQAGGFEQPFANSGIIDELTKTLPQDRQRFCRSAYAARVTGADPPAGVSQDGLTAALKACLIDVRSTSVVASDDEAELAMNNLDAWLTSSKSGFSQLVISRDSMMAQNAIHFIDRLGDSSKVVVWTQNVHAARTSKMFPDYGGADTLGSALSRRYGNRLFALAITARQGTYRWSRDVEKPIPTVQIGAIEDLDYGHSSNISEYFNNQQLRRAGIVPAAINFHKYQTADWSTAYDGILVLNEEHPPHSTRPR